MKSSRAIPPLNSSWSTPNYTFTGGVPFQFHVESLQIRKTSGWLLWTGSCKSMGKFRKSTKKRENLEEDNYLQNNAQNSVQCYKTETSLCCGRQYDTKIYPDDSQHHWNERKITSVLRYQEWMGIKSSQMQAGWYRIKEQVFSVLSICCRFLPLARLSSTLSLSSSIISYSILGSSCGLEQ